MLVIEVGQRFGMLTYAGLYRAQGAGKLRIGMWVCDCGRTAKYPNSRVACGERRQCGCTTPHRIGRSVAIATDMTERGKLRSVWLAMHNRCSATTNPHFKDYGARGISVCDRWAELANFLSDMGPRPRGYTLERINNDGNYEPSNCKWATPKEQAQNRRPAKNKKHILVDGVPLKKVCASKGIPYTAVSKRLSLGWSLDRALSTPKRGRSVA